MKKILYLLLLAFLAVSCEKNRFVLDDDENTSSWEEALKAFKGTIPLLGQFDNSIPAYLNAVGMNAVPVNNLKAGLGRVLFYDKNLSKDRSISCASCHKQEKAFSDDVDFSVGIEGKRTHRNSMPLANVANFAAHYAMIGGQAPALLWDERSPDVISQSRIAFANPVEMGLNMEEVIGRVREQSYYLYLWKQVYGNFEPNEVQVLECLQEFVGVMGSSKSPLDKALSSGFSAFESQNTTVHDTVVIQLYYGGTSTTINTINVGLPGLTPAEDRGRLVFINNCTKCHSPIRPFQEVFAACNGLEMQYTDNGLAELTGKKEHEGVFKSPPLRNIALTAPYMHDGRFKTLEEVVNFYSEGIRPHPNLHPLLKETGSLNLSVQQKQDLIAFLHTFTDNSITADPRFSNPFK